MSNKLVKEKKEEVKQQAKQGKISKGAELKAKYIEFRKNHKKLVSFGLASLLVLGGAFVGFVGNNVYYNYQYVKSQNQVGLDGDGYFLDPILNYAIQFPDDWGYATEDQTVVEKAVEDAKTNGEAFRLSQHKLPYEITPVVFAKDEGDLGYRSFMSVSFRGFYANEIGDAKSQLKTELQEILEANGHTGIEFLSDSIDQKGEVHRLIFDVKALSKDEDTGEDVVTYYHQQSMLIGKNMCTVILGTTDTKLNRPVTVSDLMLKIVETDPDYLYIKDGEETTDNSSSSISSNNSGWYKGDKDTDSGTNGKETSESTTTESNKQSIPVEGGTIEIITGTDIDIDALKEMEGLNVNDVEVGETSKDEVKTDDKK